MRTILLILLLVPLSAALPTEAPSDPLAGLPSDEDEAYQAGDDIPWSKEEMESMAASEHVPLQEDEASVSLPSLPGPRESSPPSDDTSAPAEGDGATSAVEASEPQALPPGARTDLIAALMDAGTDKQAIGNALYGYYQDVGLAPPTRLSQFGENSTIRYSHPVGDVDGDGTDDVALDTFCVAFTGCPDMSTSVAAGGQQVISIGNACGEPHALEVVSGRTGKPIWNRSLDDPHQVPLYLVGGCSIQFVVGTVPLPDDAGSLDATPPAEGATVVDPDGAKRGILLYRYDVVDGFWEFPLIEHTITLIEPTSGNELWSWSETGSFYTDAFVNFRADDIVVHPLLDVPHPNGVPTRMPGTEQALTLVTVGFNMTVASSIVIPPTFDGAAVLVNDYQPDEWATRLDPVDGRQLWRAPTFQPDPSRSVFPMSNWGVTLANPYPPFSYNHAFDMVPRVDSDYWDTRICCHDLDGDGRIELVYTTLEWANVPAYNAAGPYGYESRLTVFAGTDGSMLREEYLAEDHDVFFLTTSVISVGDTDGDGIADMLLRQQTLDPRAEHRMSLRSGVDGREIWFIENVRDMDLLPVGDVDGDGGQDLLFIEWFQYEYAAPIYTPFTNVTHSPLKIFSGTTGELLWRDESFSAVIDLVVVIQNAVRNGLPDLDGDGVAEIPIDDPIFLPDGTIIHQTSMISPVNDKTVVEAVTVGAFAVPFRVAGIGEDGGDGLGMLNGDIADLWFTLYDENGADWSRRVSEARVSSYTLAIPRIQAIVLDDPAGPTLLLDLQTTMLSTGGFISTSTIDQQMAGVGGHDGGLQWATPRFYDDDKSAPIVGASPASALFADALTPMTLAQQSQLWTPRPLAGLGSFALGLVAAFAIARRFTR